MTVIAVGNRAGSAGKTTLVVNLGARLAELGHTVRVMDLDAQANASHWLGHPDPDGPGTREVLFDGVAVGDAERPVDGFDRFTVVSAHIDRMEGVEVELSRVLAGEQRLRRALQTAGDDPSVITLLDCPGSLGTMTVSALTAADVAVTTFSPMEKESAGVAKFEATVEQITEAYNPQLRLAAVVPSIVPPGRDGKYYRQVHAQMRAGWEGLVTPPVRRSVKVPESYSQQVPLLIHAPRDGAAADIAAVVEFLQAACIVAAPVAR